MNTQEKPKLINKHFHFKFLKKIEGVVHSFSLTEKIFFWFFVIVSSITALLLLISLNKEFLIDVPARGGTLTEGIIGTPRFINPLIAMSSADKDLTALIYSGLTKKTFDGNFVPDLADRYEISENGLEYRFFLRDNVKFHDGKKVTTEDIIFTILKATDPEIESSKRSEWEGVNIEKISDTEILFVLRQPHARFIESTTLGILPKHLWGDILKGGFGISKFNTEPVGSGPYKLKSIKRDNVNIPQNYTLSAFKNYALGKPLIEKIVFHFAKNESELVDLLNAKKISSIGGISPVVASTFVETQNINKIYLPRVFGIFFNQNESKALADGNVRRALEKSISRTEIVDEILFGFATVSSDTLPPHLDEQFYLLGTENKSSEIDDRLETELISEAQKILESAGWKKNENGVYEIEKNNEKIILSIDISTNNVPELAAVAQKIAGIWRSIGVDVSVKNFETSELNQSVIRPRNFEALIFGIVINNYSDLYGFWHSSQRLDPGLNIANYTNISSDRILTELRDKNNKEDIQKLIKEFNANIAKDIPAIFLYSPDFIYITPAELMGIETKKIKSSEERFLNIHKWFIKTDKIWKIFNKI
ncbi:MAG TPA: ABC transporter substrate-binding protein [Candidatus Paceibacterota bacterium]|nr:ABC transporter substrate-binding protein [Candidatus Paceibacterota bacterium]